MYHDDFIISFDLDKMAYVPQKAYELDKKFYGVVRNGMRLSAMVSDFGNAFKKSKFGKLTLRRIGFAIDLFNLQETLVGPIDWLAEDLVKHLPKAVVEGVSAQAKAICALVSEQGALRHSFLENLSDACDKQLSLSNQ